MNIVLHIDRLVLEGFGISGAQGRLVRAALESELQHLFSAADGAHFSQSRCEASRTGTSFAYRPEHGPARLGRDVARAVSADLGQPK